jgi:hypothetical protein
MIANVGELNDIGMNLAIIYLKLIQFFSTIYSTTLEVRIENLAKRSPNEPL